MQELALSNFMYLYVYPNMTELFMFALLFLAWLVLRRLGFFRSES